MISHPLVKKEWKLLKWIMLLFGCIFAFFAMVLSNNMANEKTYHLLRQYVEGIFIKQLYGINIAMVPILMITLMIVVAVLFAHDRNIYIGKFINSLPYTRKESFKIKYVMGIITFTVPLIVFGVALYSIRSSHLDWINRVYQYSYQGEALKAQDGAGILLLSLVFIWLIMAGTYSFLMMVQTLIGQNIVASVVGGIVMLVPLFLGYAIPANLFLLSLTGRYFPESVAKWAQLFLLGLPDMRLIGSVYLLDTDNFINNHSRNYWVYNYQDFPLYIGILISGIVVSTSLAYYFMQHNDVEKNGEIAFYSWVEKLLVVGVTVCSILLLPILLVTFTRIESPVVTAITMIIGGVLGYIISTKSIELSTRKA